MWAERDRSGEEEADRDVACRASDAPSGMDFTVGLFPLWLGWGAGNMISCMLKA